MGKRQSAVYVDHMGSDDSVVNAARASFDKLSDMFTDEQNESLINFLASGLKSSDLSRMINIISEGADPSTARGLIKEIRNTPTHWTPFAHTAITLRMSAPVPIRTQCFKHKQGLVENEESRRYISSTPEIYIPSELRCAPDKDIKQGSGRGHKESQLYIEKYKEATESCVRLYNEMICAGICPEQARFVLPQGAVVKWVWTGNLFAFANFYIKRTDSHSQKEVGDVANDVARIIRGIFPVSWSALVD